MRKMSVGVIGCGVLSKAYMTAMQRFSTIELKAVADEVPPGKARWSLRTYLADALYQACRPDEALASISTVRSSLTEING